MTDAKQMTRPAPSYDADLYAWTQEQARLLRSMKPAGLDWENIAEEIQSLGRSDRHQISSRLYVVLLHLLKWQAQPAQRKAGWRGTIGEQRGRIADLLAESPTLRRYPSQVLATEYRRARIAAADETGLPESAFPRSCPFTIDQVLDESFWPEAR